MVDRPEKMQVRLGAELLELIEAFRNRHADEGLSVSRSQAVRTLVWRGLKAEGMIADE